MSVVDDLRKLLQDVVSPNLKALDVRLTAVEKRLGEKVDLKFELLDKKIESGMAQSKERTLERTA